MKRRIVCRVFLAVVLFGLLFFSQALLARGRIDEALEHAKKVQEKHTYALLARPGVVGTAVGLNDDGDCAVLVLTEWPDSARTPSHLENVPVRLVATGRFYALADPTDRFPRPVPTGVSTGHPAVTAGTIACRVTDGTDVYALSNNHIYADENAASIGDDVIQPGTFDGGLLPDDYIGTLFDYEPILFWGPTNIMDAAIALSDTLLLANATPSDGYETPSSATTGAYVGQAVQKYGRTTGLTHGTIGAVNATVLVGYTSGIAVFENQIIITPGGFSAPGDSGSLIVTDDENCNPVGLLFAGSATVTVANPIDPVLDRFGVAVDDGPQPPIANAGPNRTYLEGIETILDGSGSTDPDSIRCTYYDIVGYDWYEGDTYLGSGQVLRLVLPLGTHVITLVVTDSSGRTDTDEVVIVVTDTYPAGWFVERFYGWWDPFDLSNESVTFIPTVDGSTYSPCVQDINELPTEPVSGTVLPLSDQDYAHVQLDGEQTVCIYGTEFSDFYVGSNGYITFDGPDTSHLGDLFTHFYMKRISGLFNDLDPSAGGTVSYKQLEDRVVVTWQNVPQRGTGNRNTFQVEMYFDGTISLAWLDIDAEACLVGISDGRGLPIDVYETDFSQYPLYEE
jgi:hypothetical protein